MTTYCVQNNKGMMLIQENSDFSVNFSADYLVVPNILLTHTHTHTGASPLTSFQNVFTYARVKRRAYP